MEKLIKTFEQFINRDFDPYGEEIWENEGEFLTWLKMYYHEKEWSNIKSINCLKQDFINIDGIEKLENLEELYCGYNKIESLKGIENLKKLKKLECQYNNLISIPELMYLENLEDLECFGNQLITLDGIENLKKLKVIGVYDNKFSDEYKEKLKNYCKINKIINAI